MIARIRVPARRLLTIPEDHPVWRDRTALAEGFDLLGAVVRLHPPAPVPDAYVWEVQTRAEAAGAVRVKVVRRERPVEVVRRIDVDPSPRSRSHREVVMEVASEARSADPDALRALLGGILDEEGL